MKKFLKLVSIIGIATICLSSCGGSSSSSESLLFGKVPSIVASYQTENDQLKEELDKCKSESQGKKIFDKAEALKKETLTKVEEAAQAWNGTTLDISSGESFTVRTPLTVTFDGFFSKSDFKVEYKLSGDVVTAKDFIWEPVTDTEKSIVSMILKEGVKPYANTNVDIIGLDENGNEITSDVIGIVDLAIIGDKVGVAANTPVKLGTLVMSSKKASEYPLVKSLKLGFTQYNIK